MADTGADVRLRFKGQEVIKGLKDIQKEAGKSSKSLSAASKNTDISKLEKTIRDSVGSYRDLASLANDTKIVDDKDIKNLKETKKIMNDIALELKKVSAMDSRIDKNIIDSLPSAKEIDKVSNSVNKFEKEVKSANKELEKTGKVNAFQKVGTQVLQTNAKVRKFVNDVRFGVAEIVHIVGGFIVEVYELGVAYQQTEAAFAHFLHTASDESPAEAMAQLRRDTAGLVDDVQLMRGVNMVQLFGIPAKAFQTMSKYATQFSQITGQTDRVGEFIERISLAIARASSRRIDDFGIWLARVGEFNDPELWRDEVVRIMAQRIDEFSESVHFSTNELAVFRTEWTNLKAEIGKGLAADDSLFGGMNQMLRQATGLVRKLNEARKRRDISQELGRRERHVFHDTRRVERFERIGNASPLTAVSQEFKDKLANANAELEKSERSLRIYRESLDKTANEMLGITDRWSKQQRKAFAEIDAMF